MTEGTVKNGLTPQQTRQNHSNMIFTPQSCKDVSSKIANIKRQINSLQNRTEEILNNNAKLSGYNKKILFASLVKDTCIGFLDLAAALVPNKAAARAAELGLASISATEAAAEYSFGQSSGIETVHKLASAGVSAMPGETVLQSTAKFGAGVLVEGAGVVLASTGDDRDKATESGLAYAGNTMMDIASVLEAAATEAGESWAGSLGKGLNSIKVIVAANRYDRNLEKNFDRYLDEKTRLDSQRNDTIFHYRKKAGDLELQLRNALTFFQSCPAPLS